LSRLSLPGEEQPVYSLNAQEFPAAAESWRHLLRKA
jgi:hypothetical protein